MSNHTSFLIGAIVALSVALVGSWALGAEYQATVLSAYDGDTITVSIDGKIDRARILNIDTPEIKGRCSAEKTLALRARDFTREWTSQGPVTLTTGKRTRDKYGRLLANVTRNGIDLGDKLIEAGLAVRWEGRRNQHWCD